MSVLCIGQSGYDIIFSIPGRLPENIKLRITDKLELPGGPATCAAALTGKWGLPTYLVSRVGEDIFADAILEKLRQFQVNTDYVQKIPGANSSMSLVIRHCDNANRTAINYPGTLIDMELPLPEHYDVILTDGHELNTALEAMRRAPHVPSVLDAGSVRDSTLLLAKKVTYLVCSEVFAGSYCKEAVRLDDLDMLRTQIADLKALAPYVAVTLGEQGLVYEECGHVYHMPAYPVESVDTLGAGDIFHGSFAYAIHEKMNFTDALQLASATAALSVTQVGGMSSIPTLEQVRKLQNDHCQKIRMLF